MKYFGTDGIRGRVGEGPITPQFFLKLGWAIGQVFKHPDRHAQVLIGKDTRISGYMFESALQAGLAAAGADIMLLGPMPTPAISYLTHTFRADLGIVISASHNSYIDNGIKFFSNRGMKLSDEQEKEIEAEVDKEIGIKAADALGKAARVVDARGRYIEFCKSTVPYAMNIPQMKILLDCAHGATYSIAPKVFSELGMEIEVIHAEPDGVNINLDCGSTNTETLRRKVQDNGMDMGIAFDGDGDRVMMCNRHGNLIDGDLILYIIAQYMQAISTLRGKVVGTIMSNMGLEQGLRQLGIEMERVPVGDRYIVDALMNKDTGNLGGESSGHLVCTSYSATGDGIIAALQTLVALTHFNMSLDDLLTSVPLVPTEHSNIECRNPRALVERKEMRQAIEQAERGLEGKGRLVVRPSGTESLLRVMVESTDQSLRSQTITTLQEVAAQLPAA